MKESSTKKTFLSLLLFCVVVFVSQASDSLSNPDSVISRVWLERAYTLLDESENGKTDWDGIAEAWKIASEFQVPGRDALYLRARLILADADPLQPDKRIIAGPEDGKFRRAYKVLTESWNVATYNVEPDIVDFEERAQLWAALALRNREYRNLLAQFKKWPAAYRYQSELLYAASRAALYLGLNRDAAEFAEMGEALSDTSTELRYLDVDYGPALPAFRAVSIAAGNDDALSTLDAARRKWGSVVQDRALLPWVLSGRISEEDLRRLPIEYSDFLEAALDVFDETVRKSNAERMEELLVRSSLQKDLSVIRKLADIPFNTFSGEFITDSDYDGYPEERIKIVAGRPVSRRIDSDQDGRDNWIIDYKEGMPLQITLAFDTGTMSVNYESGAYPSVFSLSRKEGSTSYDISFNPGKFTWYPLDTGNILTPPTLPDWQESDIWNAARRVVVEYLDEEGWKARAASILVNGYPVQAEETRFVSGGDKDWTRQLLYRDGIPIAGRLSYRNRTDNTLMPLWELYERYEEGKLVGIAWTPEMSPQATFMHDWALQGILETQIWNLDNDPWIDVRRFLFPGGIEDSKSLMVGEVISSDLMPWSAAEWAPWEY